MSIKSRAPGIGEVTMGLLLRKRRREMKISQSGLGEKLGVSFQQVQKYEKGSNRMTAVRLQAIAAILDVPESYFYGSGTKVIVGPEVETIIKSVNRPTALRLLKAYNRIDRDTAHRLVVLMEGMTR